MQQELAGLQETRRLLAIHGAVWAAQGNDNAVDPLPCLQDAHSRLQHDHDSQQAELDRCRVELANAQRAQQEASAAAEAVTAEAKELQEALQASQAALLHADRRHEQVSRWLPFATVSAMCYRECPDRQPC